jgi:hypothetical protein
VYLYVVAQREQAEREQDWEQEQQEKREALEAAQRELDEVLNCNSALLVFMPRACFVLIFYLNLCHFLFVYFSFLYCIF